MVMRHCTSCNVPRIHTDIVWTKEPLTLKYTCTRCKNEEFVEGAPEPVTIPVKEIEEKNIKAEPIGIVVQTFGESKVSGEGFVEPVTINEVEKRGTSANPPVVKSLELDTDLTEEEKFVLSKTPKVEFSDNEWTNIYSDGSGQIYFHADKEIGDKSLETGYKADMSIYKNTRSQMDEIYEQFRSDALDKFTYKDGKLTHVEEKPKKKRTRRRRRT